MGRVSSRLGFRRDVQSGRGDVLRLCRDRRELCERRYVASSSSHPVASSRLEADLSCRAGLVWEVGYVKTYTVA